MWTPIARSLARHLPVFLGIVLLAMYVLRIHDPVWGFLGRHADPGQYALKREALGLDQPFLEQYATFLGQLVTLDLEQASWAREGRSVGDILTSALGPTLSITLPAVVLTWVLAALGASIATRYRGRWPDRVLFAAAVVGMSLTSLVFVVVGQYLGAYRLEQWIGSPIFAVSGYEPGLLEWGTYCLLPVLLLTLAALGQEMRFQRAVLVEEWGRPHVHNARARGLGESRLLWRHAWRNALVPLTTRLLQTLPLVFTGSVLVEVYFSIPGMGRALYDAVSANDFPVTQTLTAVFAALFLGCVAATDVLHAWLDPRTRTS